VGPLTEPLDRGTWLPATRAAGEIRRQLADARPDAFLPALASSLNNLAKLLFVLNRNAEASAIRAELSTITKFGSGANSVIGLAGDGAGKSPGGRGPGGVA
jgi:hypothetical protein